MQTTQPLFASRATAAGRMRRDPSLAPRAACRWIRLLVHFAEGRRLSRTQLFRLFQRVAGAAGLPAEKRHPHTLKHSLASHLVAGNVNLAIIKQALGHRSINSTMAYVGTTDAQAAEETSRALMGLY